MSNSPAPDMANVCREAAADIAVTKTLAILWRSSPHGDHVRQILEQCDVTTSLFDDSASVGETEICGSDGIALIGLNRIPSEDDDALAVVRALKLKGFRVLCYADGINSWSLATKSQLLLAGAVRLLDSRATSFSTELVTILREEVHSQRRYLQAQCLVEQTKHRLGLVAESAAMQSILRWVIRISSFSKLPVLVRGEAGTGKELIAKAVHQLDPDRREGPFIPVNCAAISPTIFESEFFGHRRGTFTGADRDRQGLFRAAEGGVLFLDEVGELPDLLQGKLLRVLQEGRILTMGEEREVPVDVRVVAATNADLTTLVRDGKFRVDLYSRLSILSVQLPPLRERRDDIGPLISHFLKKHQSLCPWSLAAGYDFTAAVESLQLSGNARQLENLVRWVIINKEDDLPLGLRDLPDEILRLVSEGVVSLPALTSGSRPSDGFGDQLLRTLEANHWSLARSIEECERCALQAALRRMSGNQTRTAELLGITPRSVYNKVRKHRLQS